MSLIASNIDLLTDSVLEAMSSRVYEFGWQNSGGVMPFADALGVLKVMLGELQDAEREGVNDGMPIALQQTINVRLGNIYNYAVNIAAGNQWISQFTDEVDRLHLDVWQGGFRYKGNKVLGYESKYRQLTKLSSEAEQVGVVRSRVERLAEEAEAIRSQANQLLVAIQAQKLSGDQRLEEVDLIYRKAAEADQKMAVYIESISQKENAATVSASNAATNAQVASVYENRIKIFAEQVDDNEARLADAVSNSATDRRRHQQQLDALLEEGMKSLVKFREEREEEIVLFQSEKEKELADLLERMKVAKADIDKKLSLATGYTLFHKFGDREKAIDGKWWLIGAVAILLVGTCGIFALLYGQSKFDIAFFTRLGFALPLTVAVGFALGQYSKERRLKEEYAFKSALSLSLEAYRDLVEKALDKLAPGESNKYAEFLVTSITNIFESPTERVFGERRIRGTSDSKIIAATLQQVKDVAEIIRGK